MTNTRSIFLIALSMALASCMAFHSGTMMPSVIISNANFTVLGQVTGSAKAEYVIAMGGLFKQAMVAEAKANIYKNYNLPKGVALGNITIDVKNSYYLLYHQRKVTIVADVIDFNVPSSLKLSDLVINSQTASGDNDSKLKTSKTEKFTIGDTVKFYYMFAERTGKITAVFPDTNKLEVSYEKKSGITEKIEVETEAVKK